MKTKIIAAFALLSTSFTPISLMTTPAAAITAAADPSPPDMQSICDANYVNNQEDPSVWQATVTNDSSQPTTPAPVAGTENNINFRPDTTSSFVYAGFVKADDPLTRTGGSVNMWGQSVFSQKIWDNTLYDVEMQFTHDVTYSWTCHVEQYVNHPEWVGDPGGGTCPGNNGQGTPPVNGNGEGNNGCGLGNGGPTDETPGNGQGNTNGNNNGDNLQTGGNGQGNNGCGNGNGGPVESSTCHNGQSGHWEDNYTWDFVADYNATQTNTGIDDGYDVTQIGVQLLGHVLDVNYTEYGDYRPAGVRSLACINPGKKGGTWTPKNNYTGGNCNTTYFNTAPTAYGTTFDTVTGSLPSASLPTP